MASAAVEGTILSAAPLLPLLNEPDYNLKIQVLKQLADNVSTVWPEIADHLADVEVLHEDESFPERDLAAFVLSRAYYFLGELKLSMQYALVSGKWIDSVQDVTYVNSIVFKCLDEYIRLSQEAYDASENPESMEVEPIDDKLQKLCEQRLRSAVAGGDFKHAIGLCLDARRLDIILEALNQNKDSAKTLPLINFVINCSMTLVNNRKFRHCVLGALPNIILASRSLDYFAIAKIIIQLEDAPLALRVFENLLGSNGEDGRLIAYQVAFDLESSASQELLDKVITDLPSLSSSPRNPRPTSSDITKIIGILTGVPSSVFNISFLQKHNNTDLTVLYKAKSSLEGRNSIFHTAVTFQNAFLHAGTTSDGFFRTNLDWLNKAVNWTKFCATAALGVIHHGNLAAGRRILQPYFPGNQGSCYTQGGSLFALGIIYAGHGKEVLDFLRNHIVEGSNAAQSNDNDVILHGAALGVGIAGMGSGNVAAYQELRDVTFSDSAVSGEGTGLAMGLVMLGKKNPEFETEVLEYAHDTAHEKIIRSLAMSIALMNYAKEEAADEIIETMIHEQDPILRYGGAFTIALAYAGTGNNKAIKNLLHIAVSDSCNDVRRAAVISLGFILFRNPTAVPRMVELLAESHNPHVRYGVALALGISCAGSGLKEAIDVLIPMMTDTVDFVRQGTLIALSLILIQHNVKSCPRVKQVREAFAKVINAKHEDAMAKFGAAVAQGIIDAGGRNVTVAFDHGRTGNLNARAIVGMALFTQYWYWFPLTHFLLLSFTPTTIIGVRTDLRVPQFQFECHAKLELFEYPPRTTDEAKDTVEKVATAVLSTTYKAKNYAKARRKSKKQNSLDNKETDEPMAVDEVKPLQQSKSDSTNNQPDTYKKVTEDTQNTNSAFKEDASRPFHMVENFSRVLPGQLKYISFEKSARFVPVRKFQGIGGVVIVKDKAPEEPIDFIKLIKPPTAPASASDIEAPVPEPFPYEE